MNELYNKSSKLILYVDDEPLNLMLFDTIFSGKFDIVCLLNPMEALNFVKNNPVKIVISDYLMPKMNGIQFLEILKNEFSDITRIMLTSNNTCELELEAMERCELQEFLTKPLNTKKIERILQESLSAR